MVQEPGTLVMGGGVVSGYVSAVSGQLSGYTPLGFTTAAPLSEDNPTKNVYFAPSTWTADADENGTLCAGSATSPAAAPGILCVYIQGSSNVEGNSTNVFAGVGTGLDAADGSGFHVTPDGAAVGQVLLRYVWAYRAP